MPKVLNNENELVVSNNARREAITSMDKNKMIEAIEQINGTEAVSSVLKAISLMDGDLGHYVTIKRLAELLGENYKTLSEQYVTNKDEYKSYGLIEIRNKNDLINFINKNIEKSESVESAENKCNLKYLNSIKTELNIVKNYNLNILSMDCVLLTLIMLPNNPVARKFRDVAVMLKLPIIGCFNKPLRKELSFKDDLFKFMSIYNSKIKIECQYLVDNYRIDFYIKELNLAIEYDENGHFNKTSKQKDDNRAKHISNKIGCEFLRLNYKNSNLENIAKIIKYINR